MDARRGAAQQALGLGLNDARGMQRLQMDVENMNADRAYQGQLAQHQNQQNVYRTLGAVGGGLVGGGLGFFAGGPMGAAAGAGAGSQIGAGLTGGLSGAPPSMPAYRTPYGGR